MDLYNEEINEFVDWVDGTNYLTKAIETLDQNGKARPVSGGQIRRLLQEKLRRPIYVTKGNDNMIRFFSSEESYHMWENANDDTEYKDSLVLYEFAEPSQYKIKVTGLLTGETRHIIYGDKGSQASKAIFTWGVTFGDDYVDDSIAVTYKVENTLYAAPKIRNMIYTDRLSSVSYDLIDLLDLGSNQVTITFRGQNTGASTTILINIVMVSLNITSRFQFYSASIADTISIPYQLYRNDYSENVLIHVYIDGQLMASDTKYAGVKQDDGVITIDNQKDLSGNRPYLPSEQSLNSSEFNRVHSLQIQAETTYDGVPFKSNLLYYEFAVKADQALPNRIITTFTDFPSAQSQVSPFSSLTLVGTQFQRQSLSWAYFTDRQTTNTSASVVWKIQKGEDENVEQLVSLPPINGNKGQQSVDVSFEPPVYSDENTPVYLDAYIGQDRVKRIPMIIAKSDINVNEASGYAIKLSAVGKTNQSANRDIWVPEGTQEATVSFSSNIRWDDQQGWYNNSLRLSGVDNYVIIDYNPFKFTNDSDTPQITGRTVEVEFEVEKTVSEDDTVILIGGESGTRIEIKPSVSILYDSTGAKRIVTNYKDNERIKIAFIINGSAIETIDRNLLYIVTNGVLERAALGQGYSFSRQSGNIKIGGSASGIKLYCLRVYNSRISYQAAYDNYVFDSENKAKIYAQNDIFDTGNISYEKCRNKIDTILISGNLTNILSAQSNKNQSETDVTISRHCPTDTTKDFTCEGCRIRKHGQSTLYYPITSMKIWLNKSVSGNTPRFSCPDQASLGLAKNRYKMKDTSIPANKFVLQANYADSSGVHNGGLLRLIQSSWYNARVDDKFVLRTEPQLFSSINVTDKGQYGLEHVWTEYSGGTEFPYELQIAPDSFPCVVFYQNTADNDKITYLGQYVFMEDKKSDFNYGERSIYKADPKDPFCLKTVNKKGDSDANKVWDNSNVLRIEVVNVNTTFTSYMSDTVNEFGETRDFMSIVEPQSQQEEQEQEEQQEVLNERHYRWEEDFELIYPDPEDIEGRPIGEYIDDKGATKYQSTDTTKFANPATSKFCITTKPFVDWFRWLVGTYNNHALFRETAADHLDLYKLAAYYVFFLRFGLVDSVERNVQLKTYDGVHWHYEPWDMDIALGNRNTGGIAFEPPMDRDTRNPKADGTPDPTSWAFSGRSTSTSNWLWDALEAWPAWQTIVKKVADSLYRAGLTYNKCIEMFDENYANKWAETIYNESGYFKYVKSGNGSEQWLAWLQGARTPHRHWWLTTSMDYYDAKWRVGDYVDHVIHYRGSHALNDPAELQFVAAKQTYVVIENDSQTLATVSADAGETKTFDFTSYAFTERNNIAIYGAKNIQELKLGGLADALATITVTGAYSDVLGASLKVLDLGTTLTKVDNNTYNGNVNSRGQEVNIAYADGDKNALQALQTLNIRGQLSITSITSKMFNDIDENMDLSQMQNIYAMGSGLQQFSSSYRGNAFDVVELPSTVSSIYMRNSSWNSLEFWNTGTVTSTEVALSDSQGNPIIDESTIQKNTATITKLSSIPSTVTKLELLGSTGRYECSKDLVFEWIQSIITNSPNGEAALADYDLTMDDIKWDNSTCESLITYDQLALLAKLNGLADEIDPTQKAAKRRKLRGYIVLRSQPGNLTMEQLTQIRSWFGDTVFSLSAVGSGLVIDYAYDYSQISIGEPAYYQNGNFYIKEGKDAALSITTFSLQESLQQNQWFLKRYINGQLSGNGLSEVFPFQIRQDDEGVWRVYTSEGSGDSTRAYVYTSVTPTGQSATYPGTDIISIPVVYPTGYQIDTTYYSGMENRGSEGVINVYESGNTFELYLKPQGTYDATITDVVFTISSTDASIEDNINKSYKDLSSQYTSIDGVLRYSKSTSTDASNKYGIRINAFGNIPEDAKHYTITAQIKFSNSSKNTTKTIQLVVQEDSIPILSAASGSDIYMSIATSYEHEFNTTAPSNIYKYHLARMTEVYIGNHTWSGSNHSVSNSTIDCILTLNGDSILNYLPNVTLLDFSGCSILEETYDNTDQLDFSNNQNLQTLKLNSCAALSNVDLTGCSHISGFNATGTTLNVTLPENITMSELSIGSPSTLSLHGITVSNNNFSISSSSNLTNIDLRNVTLNEKHSFGTVELLTNLNVGNLTSITLIQTQNTDQIGVVSVDTLYNIASTLSHENITFEGTISVSGFRDQATYLQNLQEESRFSNFSVIVDVIYYELEYVKADGGQYVYLQVYPFYNTTRVNNGFTIRFNATGDYTYRPIIGYRAGQYTGAELRAGSNNHIYYQRVISSRFEDSGYTTDQTCTINCPSINTPYGNISMQEGSQYDWEHFISRYGISRVDAILGSATDGYASNQDPTAGVDNSYKFKGDIYYVKFYRNGSLVRDMIPCKSSDGDVGFFDKISKKLFKSSGSAYIAGPIIENANS